MSERISFTEFKAEFLVRLAIMSSGDFNKSVPLSELAAAVPGKFPNSWILEADKDLRKEGKLGGYQTLSDQHASLTGAGMEAAERHARTLGIDIEEEIEELESSARSGIAGRTSGPITDYNEPGPRIDWNDARIKMIDNTSDIFIALEREIKDRLRDIQTDNAVMTDAAGSQHAAEIEAGSVLLKASQADTDLIKRLFIPSLTWFSKKLRDEAAAAAVKKLIAMLLAWLSSL